MKKRIIGVDPGSSICGVCVLDDGHIVGAFNWTPNEFWNKITTFLLHRDCTIVLEDIRPYSLQLTPQVVDTCKFIGEALYRLRNASGATVVTITRFDVKKWVYDSFPESCEPLIRKKIDKKMFLACDVKTRDIISVDTNGKGRRKQSFVYVDDKVVTESMKILYKIPLPPPGSGYKFGLKDHSWQALAAASFFIHSEQKTA